MSDESDKRDDLRATVEVVEAGAERLAAIEARKGALDPANPQVAELSREAERLAEQLHHHSRVQRSLAETIAEEDA